MLQYTDNTPPVKSNFAEYNKPRWLMLHGLHGGTFFARCGEGFELGQTIKMLTDSRLACFELTGEDRGRFVLGPLASEVIFNPDRTLFPFVSGAEVEYLDIQGTA
jgi:hypothetical protein